VLFGALFLDSIDISRALPACNMYSSIYHALDDSQEMFNCHYLPHSAPPLPRHSWILPLAAQTRSVDSHLNLRCFDSATPH
jgi:hypothetical protein